MNFLKRIWGQKRQTGSPKIFGVGLGKTGTTSLHFALESLGFRSAHASTVFSEIINQEARDRRPLLSTLENDYDAFIDWPISHLIPQLDRRFPGSRFILTLRESGARYRSSLLHVQEDWARSARGLSYAWLDLKSEDQFRTEDEEHTRAVLSYFRGRPNDLLVMRIAEGSWHDLCLFLGLPVPGRPFPHHKALGSHDSHFFRLSPVEPRPARVELGRWVGPARFIATLSLRLIPLSICYLQDGIPATFRRKTR